MMENNQYLKNAQMKIMKNIKGVFCPYCGEQMYYTECYLKTPIKNEEYDPNDICSSQTIAFNKIIDCIELSDSGYDGCGAKFSLDNKEIGYYEYMGRNGYVTSSCSTIDSEEK